MHVRTWLGGRDRGFAALRRAARTAIVMPALFALGARVIGNGDVATFAAFGSFAMLLLVDFIGPMRERIQAQVGLAVVGAFLVCLGTLASRWVWLAASAMAVVAFAVLFAGVVSSVLAGASTSLLLAFILPVTQPGSVDSIAPRLAGWGLASVAGVIAIAVLWPAPPREPLRAAASLACRALSTRLRADVDFVLSGHDPDLATDHDHAITEANDAVAALHTAFLATPYRPTGLSTSARTVVRLVDELNWLQAIVSQPARTSRGGPANKAACRVKAAAAAVLEQGADLLQQTGGAPTDLEAALTRMTESLQAVEAEATTQLPVRRFPTADGAGTKDGIGEFITALDPSFRAQELSFAVSLIAGNIVRTAAAERRTWWERLLGRQPRGLVGSLAAAGERATAHVERHSVWLHNSIRGAVGLGLAVLVADLTGVQHSFWVVLATLSVLRSNALNTGQNALRGVLGTVAGFVLGAALLAMIGTNPTALWILLPIAILVAGIAPAVISFAAGQAGFTITLLVLFNIIAPTGWRVGLLRIEDIALGCAVSLVVGLLFWPRGAGAALRQALAEAYVDSAAYLTASVAFGLGRCDTTTGSRPSPTAQALRAAGAARRLDDTLRTYLAERGAKQLPLAQVTAVVTGVAGVRLAGDAILDLWQRDNGEAAGDRTSARIELGRSTDLLSQWYSDLGNRLIGQQELPRPLPHDKVADGRLIDAVRHDLQDEAGNATSTAVRIIWTGDHLDAVRRLQSVIVGPASGPGTPVLPE